MSQPANISSSSYPTTNATSLNQLLFSPSDCILSRHKSTQSKCIPLSSSCPPCPHDA
jgi:hypothetical protein